MASHPLTNLPVKGVQLKGLVEVDTGKEDVELSARAVTDAEGRAALDFNLPKGITDEETRIKVHGSLGGFVQESDAKIEFDTHARILITTDKTLYQPGQILHLRALVFDPLRRALPNTKASLTIEDERGEEVFSTEMETSRFGVGFADWQIPENAPLGDYFLTVELDEDRFEDSRASHYVKISRYDLPNFAVEAKPNRPYYLPGQNGEVEIRADYLFGQPVMKGRVRVVRERERRWDFRTQKWETDEGETYEGELDAEGRFRVRVDLSKEHAMLSELGYAQFLDLQYAAYLTDATTNRTEQRRFALRLSKEPIHLYIIDGGNRQAEGVPLEFYVSTFYPDGTPAECDVEIQTEEGKPYSVRSSDGQPVRYALANRKMLHARTNRYGVAKITGPPVNAMRFGNGSKHINVRLVARDRAGRVGRQGQDFWLSEGLQVRVQTDKTVYRKGEPVRLTLFSSHPDATLLVEVASRNRAIRSTTVRLENGRAASDACLIAKSLTGGWPS